MKVPKSDPFLAVVVGFLCLAVPVHAGNTPKAPAAQVQAPGTAASPSPNRAANPLDDFLGLTYTEDQKAAIRKVHDQNQLRLETIKKDTKLNEDQKAALMRGYLRMEYVRIYDLLNSEQQAEIRKKIAARHEQESRQKQQPPQRTRPN
jgi:hypothetical protein